MTLPVLGTTMVTPPMLVAVTPMPTTVQNMMLMAVPKMDTRAVSHTMRLGASLRDRATLPSPLRGLDPSGGYPSRLRSLRSLRAPLARRLASLTAAAGPTRSAQRSTPSSGPPPRSPRAGASRSARRGLRLARPGRLRRLRASPPARPRHRLRQRAAHDPVQLPLHFPPLKRRGGSDAPLSPAPISRTSMLLDRPS